MGEVKNALYVGKTSRFFTKDKRYKIFRDGREYATIDDEGNQHCLALDNKDQEFINENFRYV